MEKNAKKLIVYSLAGILLSGVGAQVAQAAPQNRDARQQVEQTEQQRLEAEKKEQQRANVQKQERQRVTQQEQQNLVNQRQQQQRVTQQEQQRLNTQKQEQQRLNLQRTEQNRQNTQKQEQQRLNLQRTEQNRLNTQNQEQHRLDLQRTENQRLNVERQEQQRLDLRRTENQRLNIQQQNDRQRDTNVRRHVYSDDRYRASNWQESRETIEHRQPWEWRTRNHYGRQLISDGNWDRQFPGLRSYRWQGAGFWYQGIEYRDLVLFYDNDDSLVAVGFWNHGRFIMVRDDDRSYFNDDAFVLGYRNSLFQIKIQL